MMEIWPSDAAHLDRAATALAEGGLVAFPTETVYGVGARADDDAAVKRIFEAKGRPSDKPIVILVRDVAAALAYADPWTEAAAKLADAFWPGPLTIVVPKSARVLDVVCAGGATVAVRASGHPITQALLSRCAFGLATPSANRSGEPPPSNAPGVVEALGAQVPCVLDGGVSEVGVPSTVVDASASSGVVRVLREGTITRAMIANVVACGG